MFPYEFVLFELPRLALLLRPPHTVDARVGFGEAGAGWGGGHTASSAPQDKALHGVLYPNGKKANSVTALVREGQFKNHFKYFGDSVG